MLVRIHKDYPRNSKDQANVLDTGNFPFHFSNKKEARMPRVDWVRARGRGDEAPEMAVVVRTDPISLVCHCREFF